MNTEQIYKLHQKAKQVCTQYAEAFAKIMGDEQPNITEFFIGLRNPDIFGVVCINDMYFSMSDLCTVIGEYEHWLEKYGNNLPQVIKEWYYYSIGDSEKWGRKTPAVRINLQSWLMGARPTEEATSDEYKQQHQKELEEAHHRTEQAKQDLLNALEDEYHHKMSYHH